MKKKILFLLMLILSGLSSCNDGVLDAYDDSVVYNLRDRGPAGGWIFYINPNYKQDGWRYLEAAPSDEGTGRTWSSVNCFPTPLLTGTEVGDGKNNTDIIAAQSTDSAAQTAKDCRQGGYSDWFLPSKGEASYMCWELRGYRYNSATPGSPIENPYVPNASSGGIGNFNNAIEGYWTSSDYNGANAYDFQFINGNVFDYTKTASTPRVRPIRRF
jgi:Protein of unknown function (DUF1566)